ncbi:hypothetical protein [Polymorphospora sp. NPDC050346]|uniref:hypothetical protein n=1 Tax=Polymorphospora sp. NPDC050346 TaxID=3155780 RepID=UPI0033EBCCB5
MTEWHETIGEDPIGNMDLTDLDLQQQGGTDPISWFFCTRNTLCGTCQFPNSVGCC